MKTAIKGTAFVLAVLLLLGMVAGCGNGEIKSSAEEAEVIAKIGDFDIRYEEIRYLSLTGKEQLKSYYGEGIFDGDEKEKYEEMLLGLVENMLIQSYSILSVCEQYELGLDSKEVKKEVQAYVDDTIEEFGGIEEYKTYLTECYMNDAVFRLYSGILSSQYLLFDKVAEEKEKEAYDAVFAHDGFIRTRSIFVQNDEGEDVEVNREKAQKVRDEIAGGASIESFIGSKYNQDVSDCDYYFVKGYMEPEYEDAAFALEVGEVSEVVPVADGFYVIVRAEPEDEYFIDHLEELMQIYLVAFMNLEVEKIADSFEVAWNETGKTLVLSAIE